MTRKNTRSTSVAPTQRQQRVGEEIRSILSGILQRGEIWDDVLQNISITISEVKVSVDIRHAFIFIMPLGGANIDDTLKALKTHAPQLRKLLGQNMHLKVVPQLHFHIDSIFENVDRIERLLNQPHVKQDLIKESA